MGNWGPSIADSLGDTPLAPPPPTLTYGADVMGFAFFENKFDVPHVALARCSATLPRSTLTQPCALEFHFLGDARVFIVGKQVPIPSLTLAPAWVVGSTRPSSPRRGKLRDRHPSLGAVKTIWPFLF